MKKNLVIYITFIIALVVGGLMLILGLNNSASTAVGMTANLVMLVCGVWLLVKGADWFVDSASGLAKLLKIAPLIIGLTIVSFGTSAPELAVSLTSAIKAKINHATADISLGNVVGSNIANLLLVLGLSVAITPIMFKKGILRKEFPFLIVTQLVLAFFAFDNFLAHGRLTGPITNVISRGEALVLLLLIILFVYILVHGVKHPAAEDIADIEEEAKAAEEEMSETSPIGLVLLFLLVGLVGIVLGGVLISDSAEYLAIKMATAAGADESNAMVLVGLTVVAVGTSLPELVTSCVAAHRGENEIALGNVIGSNIFNTALILGAAGVACDLGINDSVLIDILIMIAVTFVVFIFAAFTKRTTEDGKPRGYLARWQGIVLFVMYALYIAYVVIRTLM